MQVFLVIWGRNDEFMKPWHLNTHISLVPLQAYEEKGEEKGKSIVVNKYVGFLRDEDIQKLCDGFKSSEISDETHFHLERMLDESAIWLRELLKEALIEYVSEILNEEHTNEETSGIQSGTEQNS